MFISLERAAHHQLTLFGMLGVSLSPLWLQRTNETLFIGWLRKADESKHTPQQQQRFYVGSLPPPSPPPPVIPQCVLRGLESRGKPSFLEPYLSCSLPSCKHPADASRHTDINIISNLLCIFFKFFFFFFFRCLLPALHLQKCTVSYYWGALWPLLKPSSNSSLRAWDKTAPSL